ncbi:Glycoside hydrolase family 3 protein [Mycena chlorophos]|uniref:beta-glucosidase n=1 Tax=Mycena chlorophos TaxID=658473 RepID=A0A8H6TN66_MYCCL|nr:Glycoside hydrolase family 3 protein [Mycena chlorophos]
MLRTKLTLGLFKNPYAYPNYTDYLRTPTSREVLHDIETEAFVLLQNNDNTLPIKKSASSIALIGPQADRVTVRFSQIRSYREITFRASLATMSSSTRPTMGLPHLMASTSSSAAPKAPLSRTSKVNFAQGCELWSNDQSGFDEAVSAAKSLGIAVATGYLVKAVQGAGKPTVAVFVSGKPVAEPWIQDNVDAVVQQFYPGELGGLAIAEVLFGAVKPSGKLPVSFPRSVGTTPIF